MANLSEKKNYGENVKVKKWMQETLEKGEMNDLFVLVLKLKGKIFPPAYLCFSRRTQTHSDCHFLLRMAEAFFGWLFVPFLHSLFIFAYFHTILLSPPYFYLQTYIRRHQSYAFRNSFAQIYLFHIKVTQIQPFWWYAAVSHCIATEGVMRTKRRKKNWKHWKGSQRKIRNKMSMVLIYLSSMSSKSVLDIRLNGDG